MSLKWKQLRVTEKLICPVEWLVMHVKMMNIHLAQTSSFHSYSFTTTAKTRTH